MWLLALLILSACERGDDGPDAEPTPSPGTSTEAAHDRVHFATTPAPAAPPSPAGHALQTTEPEAVGATADAPPRPDSLSGAPGPPVVVLMIGDGMGYPHLDAASLFAHGERGRLFMQSLPGRGSMRTASLSGVTDSAASATALSTGVVTINGHLGVDRDGRPLQTLVDRALELGLGAGAVTTAVLPHATPAAFLAHTTDRYQYGEVVADIADTGPHVLLGCGSRFTDTGSPTSLSSTLASRGYAVVRSADELAEALTAERVLGVFAESHCAWEARGRPDSEPSLGQMTLAALEILHRRQTGFFLVIEGARIDMAGHDNLLVELVHETVAFDAAVRAAADWARGRPEVTLIVTSDHETGGLSVGAPDDDASPYPPATWTTTHHTNADVPVFAMGPGAAELHGRELGQADLHAIALAAIERRAVEDPPITLRPDGDLGDFRTLAAHADPELAPGPRLRVETDARGLALAVANVPAQAGVVIWVETGAGSQTQPSPIERRPDSPSAAETYAVTRLLEVRSAGLSPDIAVVSLGGSTYSPPDVPERAGTFRIMPAPAPLSAPVNTNAVLDPGPGSVHVAEAYLPWAEIVPDAGPDGPIGVTLEIAATVADSSPDAESVWLPAGTITSGPAAAAADLRSVAVVTVRGGGRPPEILSSRLTPLAPEQ